MRLTKRQRLRGFTLLELVIALAVSGLIITAGMVFAGHKVVDDREAVRAAAASGLAQGMVVERHDVLPMRYGCGYRDSVAFVVAGTKEGKTPESDRVLDAKAPKMTVCCASWFRGCTQKK